MGERRRSWRLIAVGAVVAAGLVAAGVRLLQRAHPGDLAFKNLKRHQIAPGIEIVFADLFRNLHHSGRFVAVYAEPQQIELSILLNDARLPMSELAQDALLVVNGSYFTPEHRPTGLLISEGQILSPLVRKGGGAGTGVLLVADGRVTLLERERVKRRDYENSVFAIQAGPRVIEPGGVGGIRSDDGLRANRTVIGADSRGRIVLAVTYAEDGSRSGATLFELMQLLGAGGLGEIAADLALDFALNLDGGPSTGLFLRDVDHAIDLPEASRVYSVLALRAAR